LLRVLLYGTVPCRDSRGARDRRGIVLRSGDPSLTDGDWLASARTSTIAWWLPKTAMVATLLARSDPRDRLDCRARLDGRGLILIPAAAGAHIAATPAPNYLAIIVPVIVAGVGIVPLTPLGWIALGIVALGGSGLIWFATERAWGKFRQAA